MPFRDVYNSVSSTWVSDLYQNYKHVYIYIYTHIDRLIATFLRFDSHIYDYILNIPEDILTLFLKD